MLNPVVLKNRHLGFSNQIWQAKSQVSLLLGSEHLLISDYHTNTDVSASSLSLFNKCLLAFFPRGCEEGL